MKIQFDLPLIQIGPIGLRVRYKKKMWELIWKENRRWCLKFYKW